MQPRARGNRTYCKRDPVYTGKQARILIELFPSHVKNHVLYMALFLACLVLRNLSYLYVMFSLNNRGLCIFYP